MRNELDKRPLLVLVLALTAGITSAAFWWHSLFLLPLVVLLQNNINRALLLGGLIVGYAIAPAPATDLVTHKGSFDGNLRIDAVPKITQTASITQATYEGRQYQLILPRDAHVSLGDELSIQGEMKPLSQFSEQRLALQGIGGTIQADEFAVQKQGPQIFRWGMEWRKSFMSFTEHTLDRDVATMVDALCFNVDAALDKDSYRNLQRTGTIHIVSASGLHVFIFGAALAFLFSKLPIPRWVQLVLLVLVLLVYAGAAGFRPPIVRSVAMGAFYISAYLMRREADLLSALAAAALAYLIFDPVSIYDIGFQLSFITVGALALYLTVKDTFAEGNFLREKVWESLKSSFVATVAAAPVVAFYFGTVSIIALPANLLIAAVLPLILCGALAGWALSPLTAAGSQFVMDWAVRPYTGWVSWVTETLGEPSFAAVHVPAFNGYWILVFYAVFLVSWRKVARKP